jgi:hypothetical protein
MILMGSMAQKKPDWTTAHILNQASYDRIP